MTQRLRAVVADDERLARQKVRRLAAAEGGIEVIAECATGRAALQAVREHDPDLLFLDVRMPGLDGLDVVEELAGRTRPRVIFTTAHAEYAVRAFGADAVDYLLKPFDRERFAQAIARARRAIGSTAGPAPLSSRTPSLISRFLVTTRDRMVFVDVADIHWIAAEGKYVRLYTAAGSYLLREGINRIEARLDPRRFVRIHRSSLVNVRRVKEMVRGVGDDYVVRLHDGTELPMSRRHRARIREMH